MIEDTAKTLVIIQGPIVSFGQGPNNSVEGFSATACIEKNVAVITGLRMSYVYVAWRSDFEKNRAHFDDLGAKNVEFLIIEEPESPDPDHRVKQHYSVLEGINACQGNRDFDTVMKIRSDMEIPKEVFLWCHKGISGGFGFIVSEMHSRPFYCGDFVYAASKVDMLRFLAIMVEKKDSMFHPTIAVDIGMAIVKSFSRQLRLSGQSNIARIVKYWGSVNELCNHWYSFKRNVIVPLPQELWSNIVWRGKKMDRILDPASFVHYQEAAPERYKMGVNLIRAIRMDIARFVDRHGIIKLFFGEVKNA